MINLPENPTPEQFEQAEPLIVQSIIEDESNYGSKIRPLKRIDGDKPKANEFVRVAPGEYKGVFQPVGGKTQFAFEIGDDISYIPLNPETLEASEDEDGIAFNEALEFVSPRTREIVFQNGGTDALEELYSGLGNG